MVQVIPQFQINQIFAATPAATTTVLRPLVVGPDYVVRRYTVNKAAVLLGSYVSTGTLAVAWPGLQTGEIVDLTYTSVNVDNAYQKYATDASTAMTVGGHLNEVACPKVLVTNGYATRDASIPNDVKVGDAVRLVDIPLALTPQYATIVALIPDVIAAAHGSVVAGGTNVSTPTTAVSGTYTGTANTTYVLTISTGGALDGAHAKVTVTTTTGIDAGGPYFITTAVPIVIGALGLSFTFTSASPVTLGDSWSFTATAAAVGGIHTVQLDSVVNTNLQAIDLQVDFHEVSNIVLPALRIGFAPSLNWTSTASTITLNSGIVTYDSVRFPGTALYLMKGTAYSTYRALRTANANAPTTINVASDIVANFSGVDDPDSGMSYGLYRSISNNGGNTLNTTTAPISAVSVVSNDITGYNAALAVYNNRTDCYRAVPLTQDAGIQAAVISFVKNRSTPTAGQWMTAMVSLPLNPTKQVATGLATVTNSGGSNILVTDTSGTFITSGVKPGDTYQTTPTPDGFGNVAYISYTVSSVVTNQTLLLTAGPASPVSLATTYNVVHNLSTAEQVADWGTRTQALSNHRVTSVWPPSPKRLGTTQPGYYLACSLAALRGAAAPQQGLTNAAVADWDDLSQASQTFGAYITTLLNYGAYLVSQTPAGQVYIVKQLTTDLSTVQLAEDSATVNFDSLSYYFLNILAPFVGKTNVVSSNLIQIAAAINSGIVFLTNNQFTSSLGGQISSGNIAALYPSPTLLDTVVVNLNVGLPIPLNNGVMTIVASV